MERYDYEDAVRGDLKEFLHERIDYAGWKSNEIRAHRDELYDDAFVDDSVTGNASGSYTCNSWQAEENLCHNFDLIGEMEEEFGELPRDKRYDPETLDVSIRCMMLGRVFDDVLEDVVREYEAKEDVEAMAKEGDDYGD